MEPNNHLTWSCDEHTSSDLYTRRFEGSVGRLLLGRQNDLLLSFLGDLRGKKLLDVGAGHGQLAATLKERGAQVTALGSSERALAKVANLGVTLAVSPLYPLPFGDGEFDAVVTVRSVTHVPDWPLFLTELCRVSRRKVVFDFSPTSFLSALKPLFYRLKQRNEPGTRDFTLQREADIRAVAQKAGFTWKASEREFVIPFVLHRMAGAPVFMPLEKLARALGLTRILGGPMVVLLEKAVPPGNANLPIGSSAPPP